MTTDIKIVKILLVSRYNENNINPKFRLIPDKIKTVILTVLVLPDGHRGA